MKIKALSLWQPWASLVAMGAKKYETRSWKTSYRGSLLICAANGGLPKTEIRALLMRSRFYEALSSLIPKGQGIEIYHFMPFGKAVAIAELTDCLSTFDYQTDWIGHEATFGDFSPGRYAWKLENVRAIEPFTVKGQQRLFDLELSDDQIRESSI